MGNCNSGRGGLPHQIRREIGRLLDAGWANVAIARHLGIDVSTVSRHKAKLKADRQSLDEPPDLVRCGSCGGLVDLRVFGHCRPCYLRATGLA